MLTLCRLCQPLFSLFKNLGAALSRAWAAVQGSCEDAAEVSTRGGGYKEASQQQQPSGAVNVPGGEPIRCRCEVGAVGRAWCREPDPSPRLLASLLAQAGRWSGGAVLVEGVGAVPRPAGPEWGAALAHGGNVRPVTSAYQTCQAVAVCCGATWAAAGAAAGSGSTGPGCVGTKARPGRGQARSVTQVKPQ